MLSFSTMAVQYLVPCAIVTFCYVTISRFLANRPILTSDDAKHQKILAKRRQNNLMLIAVSVTHFTSWLPLNVANVIITTMDSEETPLFNDLENLYITYAICHLASMTSAISNPILYGFMNDNFRKEFSNIWQSLKKCSSCKSESENIEMEEIPINDLVPNPSNV